ncbi:MAG: hypothetical protein AAF721_12240 [Myxococcota bacterium]
MVLLGVLMNEAFGLFAPALSVNDHLLVGIPVPQSSAEWGELVRFPDLSRVIEPEVLKVGGVLAVVASVETLLNVSFLNKAAIVNLHAGFPRKTTVEIDAQRCRHIDHDVLEEIDEFIQTAVHRETEVTCSGLGAHRNAGAAG